MEAGQEATSAPARFRWLPALAVAVVFAAFALLIALGRKYRSDEVLLAWGVRPAPIVFLDTDTILSALRCLRQGVDVFETNPCDPFGRVYDYSPLWLHASVFPVTTGWIIPVGLTVDVLFIASLLLLPGVRRRWQAGVLLAAALSPPVVYALERGNNDLIIFILGALVAALSVRSRGWRLIGLGCAFLAGLLKYYPMMLMAVAVRERLRWFIGITIVSICGLAFFVWAEFVPLVRALHLIPIGSYFGDMFGARTLPFGLAQLLGLPASAGVAGELLFTVAAVMMGTWLAQRDRLAGDIGRLPARAGSFLLVGALLVIACFSTAQNIGYRAIHLLLVVPAFALMAGEGQRRRLWAFNTAVVVVLLWAEAWRHWLAASLAGLPMWEWAPAWEQEPAGLQLLAWTLRELCWWWVVTILWGVLFVVAARSRALLETAGLLTRRLASRSAAGERATATDRAL